MDRHDGSKNDEQPSEGKETENGGPAGGREDGGDPTDAKQKDRENDRQADESEADETEDAVRIHTTADEDEGVLPIAETSAAVAENIANGTVTLTQNGGEVTVQVTPDPGYKLKEGSLKYQHKDADENGVVTTVVETNQSKTTSGEGQNSYKQGENVPSIETFRANEWLLYRNSDSKNWSSDYEKSWAGDEGSYAALKFTGTGIRIRTILNGGTVKAELDDQTIEKIEENPEFTGLERKEHTLKLTFETYGKNMFNIYNATITDTVEPVEISGDSFQMPGYDVIVTAEFEVDPDAAKHTVTFQYNDEGATQAATVQIPDGGKVTQPTVPVCDGYVFDGWYTEEALTTKFDFDTEIREEKTLYAKWILKSDIPVTYSGALEDNDGLTLRDKATLGDAEKPEDQKVVNITGGWASNTAGNKGALIKDFGDYLSGGSFTIFVNACIGPISDSNEVNSALFSAGTLGSNYFEIDPFTGANEMELRIGPKNSETKVKCSKAFESGKWHALAVSYEESGEKGLVTVYLDGEKVLDATETAKLTASDTALLGCSFNSNCTRGGVYDNVVIGTGGITEDEIKQKTKERADVLSSIAVKSDIMLTASEVEKAVQNVHGWTYKGFGMLNGNSTSNLLLDYKAEHPDEYWEMMNYLFGGDYPLFTHIKMEMGNDGNNFTGAEACTMRTADEKADVSRSPGFVMAADAKKINPDVKISFLRWCYPDWVKETGWSDWTGDGAINETGAEAIYKWYRDSIFDAYEKFGYMVDYIDPDRNETSKPNTTFIKWFAKKMKAENDFPKDFPQSAKDAYHNIKIYASDENKGLDIVPKMEADQELMDAVFAAAWHYRTDGAAGAKRLADADQKEMWYSEGCATFGYSELQETKTAEYGYKSLGGYQSPLALADSFITAFDSSRRTHYIFQPALGGFYEGLQYAHKELLGGRDPWSGYIHYDPALYVLQHFTSFAKTGWEDDDTADENDSIWRVVPSATKGAFGGSKDEHNTAGINGSAGYMTLVAPDKKNFSTVFVNNTQNEKTFTIGADEALADINGKTELQQWTTTAGEYLRQGEPIRQTNGAWKVALPAYSIVTVTTLNQTGVPADADTHTGDFMTPPAGKDGIRTQDRAVLDTDATGRGPDTTDGFLYADDFDYDEYKPGDLKWTKLAENGAASEVDQDYLTARGNEPRYMLDSHGTFTVEKDGKNGRLKQALSAKVDEWNGGDPVTIVGDFRWTNYRAGIDVDFSSVGDQDWGGIGVRSQRGMNWNNDAYTLHIEKNGSWKLYRADSVLAQGKTASPKTAYRVELEAKDNRIFAYIDGELVAEYADPVPFDAGRVKISCGWNPVAFDNLTVETIDGYAPYYTDMIDGQDPDVTYDADANWTITTPGSGSADNWYRTVSVSKAAGASFTFPIKDGTGFAIIGENNGSAKLDIEIDGKRVVENASTLATPKRFSTYSWNGAQKGDHTVKVTVRSGVLTVDGLYTRRDSLRALPAPGMGHGTLLIEPSEAGQGDTVQVTAKPDTGYRLKEGSLQYYDMSVIEGEQDRKEEIRAADNSKNVRYNASDKPIPADAVENLEVGRWLLYRNSKTNGVWGNADNTNNVWANDPGSYTLLKFNGTGISVKGNTPSGAVVKMTVDGKDEKVISTQTGDSMLYEIDGLEPGEHTFKLLLDTHTGKDHVNVFYAEVRNHVNITADRVEIRDGSFLMPDHNVYVEAVFEEGEDQPISIALDKATAEVTEGDKLQLNAVVEPADSAVIWSTSNPKIAVVENGVVTGVAPGTATITAAAGDAKATCVVTVKKKEGVPVTGIALDKHTLTLEPDGSGLLTVTLTPANATNQGVHWAADDYKVVEIDGDGVVRAVGPGTATITATSDDGEFTDKCEVTVLRRISAEVTSANGDAVRAAFPDSGDTMALTGTVRLKEGAGVRLTIKAALPDFREETVTADLRNEGGTLSVTPKNVLLGGTAYELDISGLTLTPDGMDIVTEKPDAPEVDDDFKEKFELDEDDAAAVNDAVASVETDIQKIAAEAADELVEAGKKALGQVDDDTNVKVIVYMKVEATGYTPPKKNGRPALKMDIQPVYRVVTDDAKQEELVSETPLEQKRFESAVKIEIALPEGFVTSAASHVLAAHYSSPGVIREWLGVTLREQGAGFIGSFYTSSFSEYELLADTPVVPVIFHKAVGGTYAYTFDYSKTQNALQSAKAESGYEFVGWSTDPDTSPDETEKLYLPVEQVTTETIDRLFADLGDQDELHLYPIFRAVRSDGNKRPGSGGGAWHPSGSSSDESDRSGEKTPASRPEKPEKNEEERPEYPAPRFLDVASTDWFRSAVEYVSAKGIMAGNGSRFSPNDSLTRGMMAQILYNMEGGSGGGSRSFPDVSARDWFADAASWAAESSVMSGYSNGNFGPNDALTREQLAAALYRYAQSKGLDVSAAGGLEGFRDGAAVSDWAVAAVRRAAANGLLSGKSGGLLDPAGKATRAEVASILMRFCQNIANI